MVIYHVGQQNMKYKIQVYRYVYIHWHCMSIPPIWCFTILFLSIYMYNVYFYTCPYFKKDQNFHPCIHLPPSLLSEIRTFPKVPNNLPGETKPLIRIRKLRHFCFRPAFLLASERFQTSGEKGGLRTNAPNGSKNRHLTGGFHPGSPVDAPDIFLGEGVKSAGFSDPEEDYSI